MKSIILFTTSVVVTLLFISCSKKDSPTDPGNGANINVNFSLTAGKVFNYQYSELDSLNNRVGTPQTITEKINAINRSYGGFNDVIQILNIAGAETDTSYMRVVSGKDIYQWMDTSAGLGMLTLHQIKNIFYKRTSIGIWVPLVLLSKGEGAEYVTQPKRTTIFQIDSVNSLPMTTEVKVKNEGFENVTVPAGTFKAYKIKTTFKVEILFGTTPVETINLNINVWISDDLDYIVKQEQRSVTSATFKMTLNGYVQELQSTGM